MHEDAMGGGLKSGRAPATLGEARSMVAYNERILATSVSPQRVERARRMLVNLRPHIQRLEREAPAGVVVPQFLLTARSGEAYEVVWSGSAKHVSLTSR